MSRSCADLIARGLEHHRQGEFDRAADLYARALSVEPDHAEALHLCGVLAQQRGDFHASVELISRAIARDPAARYFTNLANALNQLGRSAEAQIAAEAALARDPGSVAACTNLGVALRAQGRLDEAAARFRDAVALQPAYADAHANLGVVLTQAGQPGAGEAALRRAVELNPLAAEAWANLGATLLIRARWADAASAFDRAIGLDPKHALAWAGLGGAYRSQGRLEEAATALETAARLSPDVAKTLHDLGLVPGALGRLEDAVANLERAAERAPGSVAIWMDLGNALYALAKSRADVSGLAIYDRAILAHRLALTLGPDVAAAHYNLGLALLDRGSPQEAAAEFQTAIGLDPDYAEAHCNLGHCLGELGQFEPAIAACRRALELKPDLSEAQSTLGNIYVGQNRLVEAEAAYRHAIALRPDLAGGACNLGVALFRQGRTEEALCAYDEALRLAPEMADAHWNRALVLLQRGDYAQGWPEYEWRLRRARRIRSDSALTQPLWDGGPLTGRRILLHAEQGLGDAIQCARFIPDVAVCGGDVVVQAPRSLTALFRNLAGVSQVLSEGEPAPFVDCRAPLFSLPRVFAPTLQSLAGIQAGDPARLGAYLTPDPGLVRTWAARLEATMTPGRLRVGIVWSGNRTSEVELGRSIPLTVFAPLAQPGVQLVSLQKGDGLEQLDGVGALLDVAQLGPDYDDGDFSVTAAVVEALDLVIACDTSVAHLAGALGKPVWLAINAVADWRWLEGRSDSPWYPSLRLYRQGVQGDWNGVFRSLAHDLERVQRLPPRAPTAENLS